MSFTVLLLRLPLVDLSSIKTPGSQVKMVLRTTGWWIILCPDNVILQTTVHRRRTKLRVVRLRMNPDDGATEKATENLSQESQVSGDVLFFKCEHFLKFLLKTTPKCPLKLQLTVTYSFLPRAAVFDGVTSAFKTIPKAPKRRQVRESARLGRCRVLNQSSTGRRAATRGSRSDPAAVWVRGEDGPLAQTFRSRRDRNGPCSYLLVPDASSSRSVEERASAGDRSGLAVEINAVIYYGKVETYAEGACVCASERACVCVCAGGRETERERDSGKSHWERERERERDSPLLRAALPPERDVFSIKRTRSVRHSRLSPCGRLQDSQQETRRHAHEGYAKTVRHRPRSEVTTPPDQ